MPAPKPERSSPEETRRRNFRRELIGMAAGIGLGLMAGSLIPWVRANVSLGLVVLWGGAIGGIAASHERFAQAGAIITRTQNRFANYLVGFGIPIFIIAAALYLLTD
jgi:hypothetical protein